MTEEKKIKASPKGVDIVTFGCRLNIYESEVMRHHAEDAGMTDAIIFNTCAVTKQAEREARRAIRKARRENPNSKIIVTGCAAQIDPKSFTAMAEIDQVIGNDLKLKAESWNPNGTERLKINDIMAVKETAGHLISGFDGHARAFVQVQNGCDHRCTFCIIPYGRGNSRSVPIGEIVTQVRMLV
jgi:threonylcarbamoyladenosine tRNA methylthiotransferase MtaB